MSEANAQQPSIRGDVPASGIAAAIGPARPFADFTADIWRVILAILPAVFMTNLDVSLVNVALNTISKHLHSDLQTVQWLSSGYLLAVGAGLAFASWLGRRAGFGRLWTWALLAFVVTSALCASAPGIGFLIAARVAEGFCGGLLVPSGRTIVTRAAGPQRMGRVFGIVAIAVVLAPSLGPTVGGLLIAHLSWRWLFLVNVLVGTIAFALALRLVPRDRPAEAVRPDIAGLLLLSAGLPLVLYGVTAAGQHGTLAAPAALWTLISGILALTAYAVLALRRETSLPDLRLFANKAFAAAGVTSFFTAASMFGALIILPLYLEVSRGEGVVGTGLALLAYSAGAVLAMPVGGWVTDRSGGGLVAASASVFLGISTAVLAVLGEHASLAAVEAILVVAGMGAAVSNMSSVTTGYARVPRAKLPDAVTQVNMLQRLGGATGSALFAVILARRLAEQHGHSIGAFHTTFWWLTAANAMAILGGLWLHAASRRFPVLTAPAGAKIS
jgi:EmrB/QacA subfamily drug resistance transporter